MMRRLFVCVSLFVCLNAYAAEPVSFAFSAVPVVQFAQATYRDLLGRDFVLSDQVVSLGKKVTVSVKGLDREKLPAFVDSVLRQQGIGASLRDGVYFLDVVSRDAEQPVAVGPGAAAPAVKEDHAVSVADSDLERGQQQKEPPRVQYKVVDVMNRPVDFVVAAVNAVMGMPVARAVGGSRLVVGVTKERMPDVLDLVDQVDVAAPTVEVSASFVEVTRSSAESSGLELVAGAISSKLGLSVVPREGRVSLAAGRYDLVLDALAGDGRFNQVSNGRVVGDDAAKLMLSVGDETPTIGSTGKDQLGNAVQNVVYRPSGVILDVLPHVLGSGRLSLLVDGQVSSFQATTTGVSGSPTLVKRQVKTEVSVGDGEVLVIGGLADSKDTKSSSGLSFLPASWASRSASNSKTDLVLILSARVLSSGSIKAQKKTVTGDKKQPLSVTGDI